MAEPYRKGEYVRYSCNGVCLVDDIRMDTLGKEAPKEFYILKPVSNPASTIFVPTASQALVDRMARLPNQEDPLDRGPKGPSGQLSGHHQNVRSAGPHLSGRLPLPTPTDSLRRRQEARLLR